MEGIQVSAYSAGIQGDVALIQVGGYIDTMTSQELERAIDDVIAQGICRIVVDLGVVNYISSAGWGLFLGKIKGVREKGGDIVIARMMPDVYDVFELLEFHRILRSFETAEEAIRDFDRARGWELPEAPASTGLSDGSEGMAGEPSIGDLARKDSPAALEFSSASGGGASAPLPPSAPPEFLPALSVGPDGEVPERELPLSEKVVRLVIDNPLSGVWRITRALNSSRFAYVRVSWFTVRRILKELDLDTGAKRYRFWRSR